MNERERLETPSFDVPTDLLDKVARIAETCEQPQAWVIERALRLYLAQEGNDILAIRRGREQIASGQSHDLGDVIGELEAIVAGKAA